MRYQLIVFDWDGTLMDSEARIVSCMRAAGKDLKLPDLPSDQIKDIIGLGLAEAIHRLYPDLGAEKLIEMVDRYRFHFLGDSVKHSSLFDGAEKVIAQLEADEYMLAVATGKSRRGLEKEFDVTGLGPVFHASRCADETFSKPNPQMLLDILDKLGVEAKDTLVVGDTEYDMQMAINAGADGLGVAYGVHSTDRLYKYGALDCLNEISDLPDWLSKVNGAIINE